MDRSILLVNPVDIQEPNYIVSKTLLADNAGPTRQLLQNYCGCYLPGNGHQIQYFLKAAYCEVQCSSSVVWGHEHKLLLIIKGSCSSAEAEKKFSLVTPFICYSIGAIYPGGMVKMQTFILEGRPSHLDLIPEPLFSKNERFY